MIIGGMVAFRTRSQALERPPLTRALAHNLIFNTVIVVVSLSVSLLTAISSLVPTTMTLSGRPRRQ
jgi:hypothetical protein